MKPTELPNVIKIYMAISDFKNKDLITVCIFFIIFVYFFIQLLLSNKKNLDIFIYVVF